MTEQELVLLDTDIGSDIDDAIALAYLLRQPRCALLGITTVSGEADLRAEIASAICHAAGRGDIPIFPGAEMPLSGPQHQRRADQFDRLEDVDRTAALPNGHAIEFLRRTIRSRPGEVTLLAIGPMTNVAMLFKADPEIPSLLKQLVLMIGGYSDHGHRGLDADWNTFCDAEAAAIVFGANVGVHRSTPLDVTLQVRLDASEVQVRFDSGVLELIRHLDSKSLDAGKPVIFHDPLTAATIFDEQLCRFQRGKVSFDRHAGALAWTSQQDGPHEIAVEVDVKRYFESHFSLVSQHT